MLAKTKNYRPTDKEPFMNERQREYFRVKLLAWREDILKEAKETLQHLQDENQNHPDLADRASSETDRAIELRARDRQRKLIAKIDAALARIDDGTYGYCEETGEPISLKRRWKRARSRRCRSRRRSATSGASASIATIEGFFDPLPRLAAEPGFTRDRHITGDVGYRRLGERVPLPPRGAEQFQQPARPTFR